MKKPVAFMSYAHRDDRGGRLTALREELSEAVSMHYGQDFEIFQDRDISWGQNWKERIDNSLDEVTFLIAIITPRFFNRDECRRELRRFLDRENRVNRNDLILPIYYVDTPLVNDDSKRATDELAQIIVTRQYADWRDLRHEPFDDPEVSKAMDQLARQISEVLYSVEAVEQRHSQIDNLYERARSAHQQRQWQAVIEAFAEIYSKDPLYPDSEGLLMSARDALDRAQQVDATNRYREAVKWAWMDQHLDRREAERLAELIEEFKLTPSTAAQIEREVMGETKEVMEATVPSSSREKVFETSEQTGWLEVTEKGLEYHLDDRRPGGRSRRWQLTRAEASEILSERNYQVDSKYTERSGLFSIGPRKNWLYSQRLYPKPDLLEVEIKRLLEEASG
jgi:hypothetical protein